MINNEIPGFMTDVQNSSEEGKRDYERAHPAALETYLKGINFPASKEELIIQAEDNNAPSTVMHILKKFEDKRYNSPIDIIEEIVNIT